MSSEFDIIRRHFTRPSKSAELGVGDDAAIVRPKNGNSLVVTTDMLVAGNHFVDDADPTALGWKTMAVNLSDLAAMGAEPRWALLALALPEADDQWLAEFAAGFFKAAETYGVELVGGDTTRGPLTLAATLIGEVPQSAALKRSGAEVRDDIWVSGSPGRAALGLAEAQGKVKLDTANGPCCADALLRPQPRIALGVALRDLAHAAIDVSDGLLADLRHILESSGVAADLFDADLPWGGLPIDAHADPLSRQCLLNGGDDYEIVFCASPDRRLEIAGLAERLALPLTRIGRIVDGEVGLIRLLDDDDQEVPFEIKGYDHFR